MKHLFTQLGAALIMLFALNINAQVRGLPEVGVTLSGAADNPIVENHANQAIIGHVIRVWFSNGTLPLNFNNLKVRDIWEGGKGLEPNHTDAPLMRFFAVPHPAAKFKIRDTVMESPVRAELDSVLFANGQLVGPDVMKVLPMFKARVEALQELATLALQARQNASLQPTLWGELDRLVIQRPTGEDKWKISFAGFMRKAHLHDHNDDAVFNAASHIMSIPVLWRVQ